MSRIRAQERSRQRSIAYRVEFNQEIEQRISQLRDRMAQVRDLLIDGFPYKDSERVRLELQIRQSIRQAFGEASPEFQKFQYFRLKVGTQGEIDNTTTMLQDLIARLERQKFDLPDENPRPPAFTRMESEEDARPIDLSSRSAQPVPPQADLPPASPVTTAGPPVLETKPAQAGPEQKTQSVAGKEEPPVTAAAQAPPVSPENGAAKLSRCTTDSSMRLEVVHPSPAPSTHIAVTYQTRVPGERPMIANKPRHEGADTLARDPRAEAWPSSDASALSAIRKLCTRFHAVARQLRQRHDDRPTLDVEDEHDVQDLLHAMLRVEFDDIRTERWVPAYAGSAERTTFLFGTERIALVIKRTKPGLGGREIKTQLEIDGQRYSGRPDCETLLCFVYDPEGRIANPREFEAALTQETEAGTVALQISP